MSTINTAHRPTTLRLFRDRCPRAVDHYERGAAQDRSLFAVGTAAHDVLHAIAEGRDVDGACHRLMSVGRGGRNAEPPLSPDAVTQGREIAERWAERYPPPDGAEYERRFAFNRRWQPVEWESGDVWFATRIDVVEVREEGDDDFAGLVVTVEDYKSSWQAKEAELDTLQRRAQAVVAWLTWPDAVAIRMVVSNLRRMTRHERTVWLDDEGQEILSAWRDQLDALGRALDAGKVDGVRPAVPGVGCGGCYYVAICDDARDWLDQHGGEIEDVARRWQIAKGIAAELGKVVRGASTDGQLIVDDMAIGHHAYDSLTPLAGATADALIRWLERSPDAPAGAIRAFFEAAGEPGIAALKRASRVLFSRRGDRSEWVGRWTESRPKARFGVRPAGEHRDGGQGRPRAARGAVAPTPGEIPT